MTGIIKRLLCKKDAAELKLEIIYTCLLLFYYTALLLFDILDS